MSPFVSSRFPALARTGLRLAAGSLLLFMPACDIGPFSERTVAPFGTTDELVVVVRNSPSTRFIGTDGRFSGLEQDLLELFSRQAQVRLRFIERSKFGDVLPTLDRHAAHLAAAGVSATPERRRRFLFGPPYLSVRKAVAYNTEKLRPRQIGDLVGKRVAVLAGSSSADQMVIERVGMPGLRWDEVSAVDGSALLERLADGRYDYVVTDSHVVEMAEILLPNVGRAFHLGDPEPLAWAMPKDTSPRLVDAVNEFFGRIHTDGTLRQLLDRYYGHIQRLNQGDVLAFLERRTTVLPQYRPMFEEAELLTGIDWRLLAALGFQESHWNPHATSPTGVRGLMMLTSETADRLGVTDRLDPRQNIIAGARYLRMLKDTLPERIPEPDRTWLTLAAYNVGYGHLEDARVLAQRNGRNPDSWVDLKKTLPLLARSDYYTTVKRGFARGGEAVILTENIRNYFDILVRYEEAFQPMFPEFETEVPVLP